MELKNRLYPYPILNFYTNDYKTGFFDINIDIQFESRYIVFNCEVTLDSLNLNTLINQGKATFGVHFECPMTSYRELIKFDENKKTIRLPYNKLDDHLQITTFIIAEEDLESFSSSDFATVYQGIDFSIDKHSILAIGKQRKLPIDKEYDDIKSIASIFNVVPDYEEKRGLMKSEFYGDIIQIKLPRAMYNQYKVVESNPSYVPVIHSIFIYPVLVQVFEYLKNEDWETIDYRWFRSLKRAMNKQNIDFSKEKLLHQTNPEEFAQEIFGFPVENSLKILKDNTIGLESSDNYES